MFDQRGTSNSGLKAFSLAVWDAEGAVIDQPEWGLYEVLEPSGDIKRVTFDAETAQDHPDAALVTFGSPVLQSLQEAVADWGRASVRVVIPPFLQAPGALTEKVRNLVHLVKCRPAEVTGHQFVWTGLAHFRFKVTYRAAHIIEEVRDALIDLASLADITPRLPALEVAIFDTTSQDDQASWPVLPLLAISSLDEAYWRAVSAVKTHVHARREEIQKSMASEYAEELLQSRHYYETTLQGLQHQWEASMDPVRKGRLQKKIDATKSEWAHREGDLEEAYHLEADVALDQARLIWAPTLRVKAATHQRTDTRVITFDWYPWARAWAPIVCSICHNTTTTLRFDATRWQCGCAT